MSFNPKFSISPAIMQALMRIEAAQARVLHTPLTARVLKNLRETVRLASTHYSTKIEGNRLTLEQVTDVIEHKQSFVGRDRDQKEIQGYYVALQQVEEWGTQKKKITELVIQAIHALVMGGGKKNVRNQIQSTPYRDGQNVIKDSTTGAIVYLPPEAKDVTILMRELVGWLDMSDEIPYPIRAGIAHYQFATIHPYYDGNGRTARLLATLILHSGGYGLKGLYSLEEYYAIDLAGYYNALTVGPSHNYYMGREDADITEWLEYFCKGMAVAFEQVAQQMDHAHVRGEKDQSTILRSLDGRQQKMLNLFFVNDRVTVAQIAQALGLNVRLVRTLCTQWVQQGFFVIANSSKKARTYRLAPAYEQVVRDKLSA